MMKTFFVGGKKNMGGESPLIKDPVLTSDSVNDVSALPLMSWLGQ